MAAGDEQASVLVLAEGTADSDELLEALRSRAAGGRVHFTLVVPGDPDVPALPDAAVADLELPDTEAPEELTEQVEEAVARLRDAGLEVEGRVGDADPVAAAADAVNFGEFDDIIVSTPPRHISRWLKADLAHRIEGETHLPVEYVAAEQSDEF